MVKEQNIYVTTKLEYQDKNWPELLDAAIENALKDKEASKELIVFYTDVKIAIWQHLKTNFERIIKDISKLASTADTVNTATKSNNISELTVATAITSSSVAKPAFIVSKPQFSEHIALLNGTIEKMFAPESTISLKTALEGFDIARLIAVLVAGCLVHTMQINLLPLGIERCAKQYSFAVIRVIVEKQLGAKGRLTDYNALIKHLSKVRSNKDKVLPNLFYALIKSAQMGNPYTRDIELQNSSTKKIITQSKSFTQYGLTSAVFKPHPDFLQSVNVKNPPLLFSSFSCFSFNRGQVLKHYLQLEDVPSVMPTELFFTKAAADYGIAKAQFNYGVDVFVRDKTETGLSLADKYWQLAAQQGIISAKHNHEFYLHSSNSVKAKDAPDLSNKSTRLKVAAQKTVPMPANVSRGARPKGAQIAKRGARGYKKNRETQLLRHIASQLYGFCRANKLDAIEVQLMYYANNLYIATNVINAAKLIANLLKNKGALQNALVTTYFRGNSSKIKISMRHARKIQTRVYKPFDFVNKHANSIKELLNNELLKVEALNLSALNPNSNLFKPKSSTIYVVTNRSQGLIRHAEEDLMDILEAIHHSNGRLYEEAIIYGKRRPCFSCYSRLDSLKDENGSYVKFNTKPGLFFEAAFCTQSNTAAIETFFRLSTVSTIYESSEDAGYNTLSDSDNEGLAKQKLKPQNYF